MSLIAEIEDELKDAMRAREQLRTDTLRLTLAALRDAEKELGRPLKEDEELQVLQRERKRRAEAAEAFRSAGREEQAEKEEDELDVMCRRQSKEVADRIPRRERGHARWNGDRRPPCVQCRRLDGKLASVGQ